MLPLLFALQIVMNVGIALLVSTFIVLVPDGNNVMTYVTPRPLLRHAVIYPVDLAARRRPAAHRWQPLFPLFASYQAVFSGTMPEPALVVQTRCWAFAPARHRWSRLPAPRARVHDAPLTTERRSHHVVDGATGTTGTSDDGPDDLGEPSPLGAAAPLAVEREPRVRRDDGGVRRAVAVAARRRCCSSLLAFVPPVRRRA